MTFYWFCVVNELVKTQDRILEKLLGKRMMSPDSSTPFSTLEQQSSYTASSLQSVDFLFLLGILNLN